MDLHEFRLTPRGTALVMAYQAIRYDLRSRRRAARGDGHRRRHPGDRPGHRPRPLRVAQRRQRRAARERRGAPRPRRRGTTSTPTPSAPTARTASSSRRATPRPSTGSRARPARIDWRLGGTRSDFRLGPGASFARQHDAQVQADGLAAHLRQLRPPRAPALARRHAAPRSRRRATATLVARAEPRRAPVRGHAGQRRGPGRRHDVRQLGLARRASRRSPPPAACCSTPGCRAAGTTTAPTARRGPASRRRAPTSPRGPRARDGRASTASWNGATEVTAWRVLAGASRDALAPVADAPWRDLETAMRVPSGARWFAVQALDASGNVLAISHAAPRRS